MKSSLEVMYVICWCFVNDNHKHRLPDRSIFAVLSGTLQVSLFNILVIWYVCHQLIWFNSNVRCPPVVYTSNGHKQYIITLSSQHIVTSPASFYTFVYCQYVGQIMKKPPLSPFICKVETDSTVCIMWLEYICTVYAHTMWWFWKSYVQSDTVIVHTSSTRLME